MRDPKTGLRTDRDRFWDRNYVRALISYWFGEDRAKYDKLTSEQKALLDAEVIALFEYFKGLKDVLLNLLSLGIQKAELAAFSRIVCGAGASPKLTLQVFQTAEMLVKEGRLGREVIRRSLAAESTIWTKMAKLNSNAGKILAILVCLQVAVHLYKGDYAKAIAEIGKTAMCALAAPMAMIDLVDAIIGFLLPEDWLKWPPMQVLRGMNPAQCTSMIIENLSYLLYMFGMARMNNWKAVEAAITKMCESIEKSPAGIFTYLSRDTALLMDEFVLPTGVSKFEILGFSIRNLADYARANPHDRY
jgi:hypothetical protein